MTATVTKDVLTVAGPDAQTFLHSLVSQDVVTIEPGEERWSFLLQPQGKVVGFFSIARLGSSDDHPEAAEPSPGFELTVDSGAGALLRDALQRYLIRTKATLTLREGVRVPGLTEDERIKAGLPRWGREITESTIPNETGLTGLAVNFTKGCYVGQELVERIDSRGGNVPKRLCLLEFDGVVVPPEGVAELERAGKPVGTVTSAAIDPETGRVVALGYVRREVPDGGQVEVLWPAGTIDPATPMAPGQDRATVSALPSAAPPSTLPPAPRAGVPRFTSGRR